MKHRTATAIAVVAALVACSPAEAQDEEPDVEYLVKSAKFDISMHYSSGPDLKTESSGSVKMRVETEGIHDHPRDVLFLVVQLTGYDAAETPIALNPAADLSTPERSELPLYGRRDAIMCDALFDEPWPRLRERTFTLEAPVSGRVVSGLRTLSYETYAVGFEPRDALSLLGDPLLREETRAVLAGWLARRVRLRYRYVTDDGRWVLPKDVSAAVPLAPVEAQTTGTELKYAGPAPRGPRIRVRNSSSQEKAVGIAGGGRSEWYRLGAQKETIVEMEPGLLAITIQGESYVTHTALIEANATYVLELD